jgi:hypothetical protein
MRYMVLPLPPAGVEVEAVGVTAEALEALITRDCCIGVALPRAPRE